LTIWEAAELAVDAVARLSADVAIPSLPEMGIPEEDIPMLARLAFDDPQTIGNPRDIDVAGYEMIYRNCFNQTGARSRSYMLDQNAGANAA
jgi:choline dehydrogenase